METTLADPCEWAKVNKSLKISDYLTFLWEGNISSGCKRYVVQLPKRLDIYE